MNQMLFCEHCNGFRNYTIVDQEQEMVVGGLNVVAYQKTPICNVCGEETCSNTELFQYNSDQANDAYRIAKGSISVARMRELLKKYDIGAQPLSILLDLGANTIEREMKSTVPSRAQADRLESLFDPEEMRKLLEKNGAQISDTARRKVREALAANEVALLGKYSYRDIAAVFGLPRVTEKLLKLNELRKLANVESLCDIPSLETGFACAFMTNASPNTFVDEGSLAFWLQVGVEHARKIECGPLDRAKLQNSIEDLRACTRINDCSNGVGQARKILRSCGVRAVYVPYIARMKAYGAVVWENGTPIVIISEKMKKWDTLWFALFHEIGHILIHGEGYACLKFDEQRSSRPSQEDEADQYARDVLIPAIAYAGFLDKHTNVYGVFHASLDEICDFADEIGIHRDCVVGRLGKEGYIELNSSIWHSRTSICIAWAH